MKITFNGNVEVEGDYRENVSYTIGDPLGEFSYIPHVVFNDGSVYLPKASVQMLWDYHHPNWYNPHPYNVQMEKPNET